MKKEPTVEELRRFRERVRVEILGERNKDYRDELKRLLEATDRKIGEVIRASIQPADQV